MKMKIIFSPPAHRRGFTIIELLMVIGIISILIGLLLPALSNARASSNDVACSVEMRQLASRISMYADDSQGFVPFAYTRDRAGGGWRSPTGRPIPTGYFATAASFWAYPILEEFNNSLINEALLCPNDRVSEQIAEYYAENFGIPAAEVGLPLTRSISRAFYFSPQSLSRDAVPYDPSRERVGRLANVTFPSAKALLVESEPFHDEFYIGDQFIVHAPIPYRRMVVASDLSTQLRSIAQSEPAVLLSLELPAHTPDPDEYFRLQRLTSAFDFTRNGTQGRDW